MPREPELDNAPHVAPAAPVLAPGVPAWRRGLASLHGPLVTLRELRIADAASLLGSVSTEDVARFVSPPPRSVEGFEQFIAWTHRQRAVGQYVCFGVVPRGSDEVIGLFQVRSLEGEFGTSEWGFALAFEYWGTGIFAEAAQLAIGFTFDVLGAHRLEARAAMKNGRGNGALRKIGAVQEGVLRRSLLRNGEYLDQSLWTILSDEWLDAKSARGPRVIH
jgi:RimJ/RimL family protein N-acetyltransferase